ncbi:MAG: hypothetical protein LJE96_06250 [Deltaproteobacteria bacterium]|nr:hypothetical protein [Deltaproteobacteria bacterium]
MPPHTTPSGAETVIASIQNQTDPSQRIDIKYLQKDHIFVTHGIEAQFAEKEISIPGHLVVMDFQLMGAIVSEILEKLSMAREGDTTFAYASRLQVMEKVYTLEDGGEYMLLKELTAP